MFCGFVGCHKNILLNELHTFGASGFFFLRLLISRVRFSPGNFSLKLAVSSLPGWWSTPELAELCPLWEKQKLNSNCARTLLRFGAMGPRNSQELECVISLENS